MNNRDRGDTRGREQVGGQWTGLGYGVEERYPGLSSDSGLNVWKNDDLEKQQKAWLIWRIKGGKEETRGKRI